MRKSISILLVMVALTVTRCASGGDFLKKDVPLTNLEKVKVVKQGDASCNASINEESSKTASQSNFWTVYKVIGKDGCISSSTRGVYLKPEKLISEQLSKCQEEEKAPCEMLAHSKEVVYTSEQRNEIKQRDDLLEWLKEKAKNEDVISGVIKIWDEYWDKNSGDFYIALDKSNLKTKKSTAIDCLNKSLKIRDLSSKELNILKLKPDGYNVGFY
jgi:hypothetical protein